MPDDDKTLDEFLDELDIIADSIMSLVRGAKDLIVAMRDDEIVDDEGVDNDEC